MHVKLRIGMPLIAVSLMVCAGPVAAQDVYENAVANHGQVVLHDSMLRHNLKQARNRQNARRAPGDSDARKAQACADRPRFTREYGADHPKVRQLHALCARDGY